jgi:hypothetical protein
MADPFGITAGAIGIAAAFTACVDVFEYVHLGRRFGKDYQTNQLKLTLLRLRLSRWGEAVNIYSDPQLGNSTASKAEIQAAKDTLLQILVLFDDSNKISKKFKIRDDAGPAAPDDSGADVAVLAVNNKMRDLATKRQKGTSLLKLASWSIHHGTAFKTLIDDISGLTDNLEALFPVPESRKALAKEEVANVKDPQEVQALASASEGLDGVLHEEASKIAGHQYKNVEVEAGKDATIVDGNVFAKDWTGGAVSGASHSYTGIKVKATEGLRMVNGDKYGGTDPLAR